MLRLDGAFVAAALFLMAAPKAIKDQRERRSLLSGLCVYAAVVMPWFIYSMYTFGIVLPNSFVAKTQHEGYISGSFSLLRYFAIFGDFGAAYSLVAVTPFILLGFASALGRRYTHPALLWMTLYFAGYMLAGMPSFFWYYTPPLFMIYFALWFGFRDIGRGLQKLDTKPLIASAEILLLSAVAAVLPAAMLWETTRQAVTDPFGWTALESNFRREAGVWLAENADHTDTVMSFEIGLVAYYSELEVLDILGLVTPDAIPYLQTGDFTGLFDEKAPAWVFMNDPQVWIPSSQLVNNEQFAEACTAVPDQPLFDCR